MAASLVSLWRSGSCYMEASPQCSSCLSSFLTKHRADERGVMSDGWAARSARLLCGATKKGPRQAPADRVERSTCSWRRSRATRDGATSGPALQARALGLRVREIRSQGGVLLSVSLETKQNAPATQLRRDAFTHRIRLLAACQHLRHLGYSRVASMTVITSACQLDSTFAPCTPSAAS